ncbi:MAG: hypothetical protein ACTHQE_06445, partial [Thermomicrobiales bacterium]
YIDAGNQQELDAAVVDAVRPTFTVQDASGTVVASGQVGGDPVSVPAGRYRVVIASEPQQVFPSVEVKPGVTTKILPQPSSEHRPASPVAGVVNASADRVRVRRGRWSGRRRRVFVA